MRNSGADQFADWRLIHRGLASLGSLPSNQVPFLDILRTMAIFLVLNHHFSSAFASAFGSNRYSSADLVTNGWIGVDLFFVLSGFLIGGQLWRQLATTDTISLSSFAIRRGLRIWPLYFFFYLCLLVFHHRDLVQKAYGWTDLLFVSNYLPHGVVLGGWTLCSEEQFYILAPLVLLGLSRFMNGPSVRAVLWCLLLALPVVRAVVWVRLTGHLGTHSNPNAFAQIYFKFHTHCDGLVMGLIISGIWEQRSHLRWTVRRSVGLVFLAGIAMLVLRKIHHEIFGFTGLALFFGSLVWFGVNVRSVYFQSRVFFWLSRLSFGMYLNHQYLANWIVVRVLPRCSFLRAGSVPALLFGLALMAFLSIGIAIATYCLIEYPFLELRERLLARQTTRRQIFVHP